MATKLYVPGVREFDRAAHLMERAVSTIRRHRQEAMMHGWLKALPEDTVRRSPVLSLFYGSMLMASGDVGGVEPWLDDAERALAASPQGLLRSGLQPRTFVPCRPLSPCTGPPSRRPAAMRPAPPTTPDTP